MKTAAPARRAGTRRSGPGRVRRHGPSRSRLPQMKSSLACRLSADMNHLTEEDLRDDVEGIISASDFIEMTAGAQLLFI